MSGHQKPGGGENVQQDSALRYFPQIQPYAWRCKRRESILAETVVAIPFAASLFPQHAVGFCESYASASVICEQSLLLLYLQACLQTNPEAVLIANGFTTDELHTLLDDADAVRNMPSRRDTLFLIPLNARQIEEAMTFIVNTVKPPPPSADEAASRRKHAAAAPRYTGPDWRRISSPVQFARAVQLLINDNVESIDKLLMAPSLDVDADAIAADNAYRGHLLHYCFTGRRLPKFGSDIISASGTPVHFQNDPASYFTRVNGQVCLEPIEEMDSIGVLRTLNELDYRFLFGSNPDANSLMTYHFPHMPAPRALVQVQLRGVIEAKTDVPFPTVEMLHPRCFIVDGLSPREVERGNVMTELGEMRVLQKDVPFRRFPDPQQAENIRDVGNSGVTSGKAHDRNRKITEVAYPAQFRLQDKYMELLESARNAPEETRCAEVEKVYELAFADMKDALSDPSNAMFPHSVGALYRERAATIDVLNALKVKSPMAHRHVMHYYEIHSSTANFGGDTTARVLQHLVHVLDKRLGCMSNQIIPMMMLLLFAWNTVISCDNNKHAAALLGTPASGKSQILEWVLAMMNDCLQVLEGDSSAAADNYATAKDMDYLMRVWDEKAGLGKSESAHGDSRQHATMKQMLSEGYVTNKMPFETIDENGRRTFVTKQTLIPARSHFFFLRNDKPSGPNAANPISSRLHDVQFKDPPQKEFQEKVLGGSVKPDRHKNINLAGKLIGTQQLTTQLPGHAGLDNNCDLSLLPIAVSTFVAFKLAPPLGRELKQLQRLVTAVCCQRVGAEMHRIQETAELKKMEEWQRALLAQTRLVASPADIIAAFGIWVGCAGQDLARSDMMETFMHLAQRAYTSQDAGDGDGAGKTKQPSVMVGFETYKGTHYILSKSGSGRGLRNEEDMLTQLSARIYTKQKTVNEGECPSQTVVYEILSDLRNTQVEGLPALMLVEFEEEGAKVPEMRWAISQTLLHTSSMTRTKIIAKQLGRLQTLRETKKPMRCDYYSPDEQCWIIPTSTSDPVYSGAVILAPHDFFQFPNTTMRETALKLVSSSTTNGRPRRTGKIKADDYNHEFRFFERQHAAIFEITKSNTTKAVKKVDPSVAKSGAKLSKDGMYCLEEVLLSGECLKINIEEINAIIEGEDKPNALAKGARMLQAIGYSEEELQIETMRKLWYSIDRTDTGKIASMFIEPSDLSDMSIVMRDLTYSPPSAEVEAFIGPDEDDENKFDIKPLWPGTAEQCTFGYGDNLYGLARENRFKILGLVGQSALPYWEAVERLHQDAAPSRKRSRVSEGRA